MQQKVIQFSGDVLLPAIGQGTWYMGGDTSQHKTEAVVLCVGIEFGSALIDTVEVYADGDTEKVVGEALIGLRENAFLVSKVYPRNTDEQKTINAYEASLRHLNIGYPDLYPLHWSDNFILEETVAATERLIVQGKIRRQGVSNLDYADIQELWQLPRGNQCATNQVLYHPGSWGTEYGLLPWHQKQQIPVMAYSPLAQAGRLRNGLLKDAVVNEITHIHNISAAQVLLVWVVSHQDVAAIPKATTAVHIR